MGRTFFTAILIVCLGGLLGSNVIAQETIDDLSPATGHAQVIAQGVIAFSSDELAWQVNTGEIDADSIEIAGPGFAITTAGSILTGADGDTQTHMVSGEALFLSSETPMPARNLSTDASTFTTIMLSSNPAAETGDELVFTGETFPAPTGRRDLGLIKDVLEPEEVTEVSNADAPALIYVQSGEITVENGDDEPLDLAAGAASVLTGPLTVTGTGANKATFYVAIIGSEIVPPTSTIEAVAKPTATSTAVAAGTGIVTLLTYVCPAGVSVAAAAPGTCGDNSGFGSGEFSLSGGPLAAPVSALNDQGIWYWDALAAGDYTIAVNQYPDGYSDYAIDLNPAIRHAGADILVSLASAEVTVEIHVYFISGAAAGSNLIGLTFYDCPAGTTVEIIQGSGNHGCTELTGTFDVTLTGEGSIETTDTLTAVVPQPSLGGVWRWTGLALGSYTLSAVPIEAGDSFYFVRPCGDQSCPPISGFGTSVEFELTDDNLTLLIYRIPAS